MNLNSKIRSSKWRIQYGRLNLKKGHDLNEARYLLRYFFPVFDGATSNLGIQQDQIQNGRPKYKK